MTSIWIIYVWWGLEFLSSVCFSYFCCIANSLEVLQLELLTHWMLKLRVALSIAWALWTLQITWPDVAMKFYMIKSRKIIKT